MSALPMKTCDACGAKWSEDTIGKGERPACDDCAVRHDFAAECRRRIGAMVRDELRQRWLGFDDEDRPKTATVTGTQFEEGLRLVRGDVRLGILIKERSGG